MDKRLRGLLRKAIDAYAFPSVTYDFQRDEEHTHASMRSVEAVIGAGLRSGQPDGVRDALSNVLYWGYYRMGFRDTRVQRFRTEVTPAQLARAGALFRRLQGPGLREIHRLHLPQFSQVSFMSKVRMFLDPDQYVTLDMKLSRLREEPGPSLFHDLTVYPTSVPITEANEQVYVRWCEFCRAVADTEFPGSGVRAADVERAIFHLVDTGRLGLAACLVRT